MLRWWFLLIIVFLTGISANYAQVPNGSFESWETTNQGETIPKGWNAISPDSVEQVSDAFDSSSAVLIKTGPSIDAASPNAISQGFHYGINNPSAFGGYVKTHIPGNDTVYITVSLYNEGSLTFQEEWHTTQSFDTFRHVTMDIGDVNNDSAEISLRVGCCGDLGAADPDTRLIADFLAFYFETGMQEAKEPWNLSVYPNPATDHVQIHGLKHKGQYQYRLMNNLGQLVKHGKVTGSKPRISLTGLPEGMYQLQLMHPKRRVKEVVSILKQP